MTNAMTTSKAFSASSIVFAASALAMTLAIQGPASLTAAAQNKAGNAPITVTVGNFVRAETDFYFRTFVKEGALGKLRHRRDVASIDKQDVVRMNRDTLYSSGVFDLDAGPLTVTLPDAGKRFMSMQIISQDHYTVEVVYAPGTFNYNRDTTIPAEDVLRFERRRTAQLALRRA